MLPRTLMAAAASLVLGAGIAGAQNVPAVSIAGPEVAKRTERVMRAYRWEDSLDVLKERAAKEKKLIFWLQLVGDLDGGL